MPARAAPLLLALLAPAPAPVHLADDAGPLLPAPAFSDTLQRAFADVFGLALPADCAVSAPDADGLAALVPALADTFAGLPNAGLFVLPGEGHSALLTVGLEDLSSGGVGLAHWLAEPSTGTVQTVGAR